MKKYNIKANCSLPAGVVTSCAINIYHKCIDITFKFIIYKYNLSSKACCTLNNVRYV